MTGWVPAPELAWERRERATQYTPDVDWGSVLRQQRSGWSGLRVHVLTLLAAAGAAAAMLFAPDAEAAPGQCGQGFAFGSGGGFCDGPMAPDGTWLHCETVYVLGFGGTNCFRVRAVPTTVDARGWVPA